VETQFRPEAEFSDDALRFSNVPAKVDDDVTSEASVDAQAEALSVDSPAMNTRRRSVLKGSVDSPNVIVCDKLSKYANCCGAKSRS
jgi:hypothetical protein